jgi:DNA (cytosine-5)-methyltransferase 1
MGYSRAGFEVVGVDIKPQPHYPFEFHQADALEYVAEHGREFDAIHASPPCQRYSIYSRNMGTSEGHPDLIAATRASLIATGRPYAIENVPGAPLRNAVRLCGSSFGLRVQRHRLFETNLPDLFLNPPCQHDRLVPTLPAYGHGTPQWHRQKLGRNISADEVRAALGGLDWMTRAEAVQAIPPQYTEWIGRQLIAALESAA